MWLCSVTLPLSPAFETKAIYSPDISEAAALMKPRTARGSAVASSSRGMDEMDEDRAPMEFMGSFRRGKTE